MEKVELSDERCEHIDWKVRHGTMPRVFELADILQLIVDRLNVRALRNKSLSSSGISLVFMFLFNC